MSFEIVVISLLTATDRRRRVSDMLANCAWPWRIFEARTGGQNSLPYLPGRAIVRRGYALEMGEVACFCSHYEVLLELASASCDRFTLVIEDDVLLDTLFDFSKLGDLMGAVGIDYLKLYSRFANRPQYVGRVGHRSLIRFAKESYGNQAYMVSTAGARKLTRAISRIDRPVDDEMERYWITGLSVYAIFPYPVLELNVSSTVPKGSTPNDVSFAQMALRTIYQVDEKVRREYANLKLKMKDRVVARRLKDHWALSP